MKDNNLLVNTLTRVVPSVPRAHPGIAPLLINGLQIQRSLLVEQMALDGNNHVMGRHLVPVKGSSTLVTKESPNSLLANENMTTRTLL